MKNYRNVLAVLDAGEININALEKTLLLAKLDEEVCTCQKKTGHPAFAALAGLVGKKGK